MEFINWLLFAYEKAMFYSGVAYGEYAKVGRFINDTLLVITALAVRGYKPRKWQIIGVYFGVMVLTIFLGIWIVHLNIASYNATLGNQQNPELLQILKNQEEILRKLK